MIRGIVFDLDGTLADSRLDFDLMRREMGLPPEASILEGLARLDPDSAARCNAILTRHEQEGLARATLLPGVEALLRELNQRGIRKAIATRNSRQVTDATLIKLGLAVDFALTRDDGPVKPDPWAVRHACQQWNLLPTEVLVVGDYRYDVESGRAAGCRTVLLTHPSDPMDHANEEGADLLLHSLDDYARLLAWIDSFANDA